jgi:hypothetical protein
VDVGGGQATTPLYRVLQRLGYVDILFVCLLAVVVVQRSHFHFRLCLSRAVDWEHDMSCRP